MSKVAMARIMNCDLRTVKRYLNGYDMKAKKKVVRVSKSNLWCTSMIIFKFIPKEGYNGWHSLVDDFVQKHKKTKFLNYQKNIFLLTFISL